MRLTTKRLDFTVNEQANKAAFLIKGREDEASLDADFWRLILDDGFRTEIGVFSHAQTGRVSKTETGIRIEYDKLLSAYGDEYDIYFRVDVQVQDDLLYFSPYIENNEMGLRVNECFCPLADFKFLCGPKEQDRLYWPEGLGTRIDDPWRYMKSLTKAYYQHNEWEIFQHLPYPRASMSWFGVESGDNFLYVARYDEKMRYCFLTLRQTVHADPTNLMVGVNHMPMAKCGEKIQVAPTVIGLLDGDFRAGADRYKTWASSTFYRVPEKAPWVKTMPGWQRIIMRSQYGEDYYTADDLPEMYLAGAKYGIHTLFLFGWWKEGMDQMYPDYTEPYPGAYQKLKENIQKVRDLGGRVILEMNCHFLDPKSDFYKQHGDEVKILDINGNEFRPNFVMGGFVYPGVGDFRMRFGSKVFPIVCSCTERWRQQLMKQLELMQNMEPDCLFMDCYGACPYEPCFNERHEHGNRVDEEWVGHRIMFSDAQKYAAEHNTVLATEIITDIAASYNQFVHGLENVSLEPSSRAWPQMFRYTFPEVINTSRGIRHAEDDFRKQFKWSLAMGLRLDGELYVCRRTIDDDPNYAQAIKEYCDVLDKYSGYMLTGTFTVRDHSIIPNCVKRAEYIHEDGKSILRVLYNISDEKVELSDVTLSPDEMRFDIYPLKI